MKNLLCTYTLFASVMLPAMACSNDDEKKEIITVIASDNCAVSIAADPKSCSGLHCDCQGDTCAVDKGGGAIMTAIPATNYLFVGWTGDGCPAIDTNPATLTESAICKATCAPTLQTK